MSPGDTPFTGIRIHVRSKCQERYKRGHVSFYVCAGVRVCVRVCVLCQTVTSCSPESKVHPQQNGDDMRSRVCRMLIVYTHIPAQDLEH